MEGGNGWEKPPTPNVSWGSHGLLPSQEMELFFVEFLVCALTPLCLPTPGGRRNRPPPPPPG